MNHKVLVVSLVVSLVALSVWCFFPRAEAHYPGLPDPDAPFADTRIDGQSVLQRPRMQQRSFFRTGVPTAIKELGIYSGDNALLAFVTDKPFMALRIGPLYGLFFVEGELGNYVPKTPKEPKAHYDFDENTQNFSCKNEIILPGGKAATYTQDASVNSSGIIEAHWGFGPSSMSGPKIPGLLRLNLKYSDLAGKTLEVDGKPVKLPLASYVMRDAQENLINQWTPVHTMRFLSHNGANMFGLELPDRNRCSLVIKRGEIHPETVCITITSDEGNIRTNLDIRVPEESPAARADAFHGVSFWNSSRFVAPDYGKSINLFQNPSFEGGMRYYNFATSWSEYHPRKNNVFSLTEKEAKSGRRSLKIQVSKSDDSVGYIRTFAIPVKLERKYTVSFYAKTEQEGTVLRLRGFTSQGFATFDGPGLFNFSNSKDHAQSVRLTSEWKRYVVSFISHANAFAFGISPDYLGKEESGTAYVDGLQMEEGAQATDYVEKPVCASLDTSSPDNFFDADAKIDAKLRISAPPGQEGEVKLSLKNFFGEEVWSGHFNFSAGSDGVAMIPLLLDREIKQGVYVMRADFKLSNEFTDSDFFRLTRMQLVDRSNGLRGFFTTLYSGLYGSRGEDAAKRLADIGYGCVESYEENYTAKDVFDTCGSPADLHEMCEKYGLKTDSGMLMTLVNRVYSKDDKSKQFEKLSNNEGRYWTFTRDLQKVTPEFAKAVEDLAYEAAKARPWITYWDFSREMEGLRMMINYKDADVAQLLISAQRGLKRGNPNAMFRMPDSATLDEDRHEIVKRYFEALTAIDPQFKADALSANHYSFRPENSDTDENLKSYLLLADKMGYSNANVYLLEGMYFQKVFTRGIFAKEWGSDRDSFRVGFPSYDMPWSEKMYAAYCARQWVMGLKYRDRVKRMNNWGQQPMDFYLTPEAYEKVPNTLCNMLGNAVFKEDIRFSPGVRCYVFEDAQKRPAAVVWTCMDDVDDGLRKGYLFNFKFGKTQVEAFDLMGNQRSFNIGAEGAAGINLNSYPVFLRGEAGSLKEFVQALNSGVASESLGVMEQKLNAKLKSLSELEVTIENQVGRDSNVEFNARVGSENISKSIQLKPNSKESISLNLKTDISFTSISKVEIPASLTSGSNTVDSAITFDAFAIKHVNAPIEIEKGADQWKGIPEIAITNKTLSGEFVRKLTKSREEGHDGDLDVKMQAAWDVKNLYLRIAVRDDVFTSKESIIGNHENKNPRWANDCLQLYMDTLCNAHRVNSKGPSGYDLDDLNYDFYPNKDGSVDIYRGQMPEIQLQGGVASAFHANTWVEKGMIQAKMEFVPGGYVYLIAIPASNLRPFALKSGAIVGFSLTAVDNDEDIYRKSMRVMTPAGTEGFRNPQLYPIMYLSE